MVVLITAPILKPPSNRVMVKCIMVTILFRKAGIDPYVLTYRISKTYY